jgi:class 3 adenylate cyclase
MSHGGAASEIVNKYSGTLERYAGDGVMVVFNDPIPVDNPALQAVLMAIDMRAAITELIEKWRKSPLSALCLWVTTSFKTKPTNCISSSVQR